MRTILATAAVVVTLAFPLQAGDTSKELGSQNPAPVGLPGGMSLSLEAMTAARHHWPVVTPDCPRTAKLPLPHDPVTGRPFRYTLEGNTAMIRGTPPPGHDYAAFNIRYAVTVAR